jgi:hypothetical protein
MMRDKERVQLQNQLKKQQLAEEQKLKDLKEEHE